MRGLHMRKINIKKAGKIFAIVILLLCTGAVVTGVLNALIADGQWSFGWSDYQYDDSGYSLGEGSVGVKTITEIDLDWIDGNVRVIVCDDTYISFTEKAPSNLTDDSRVHWKVSEDGKTLSIKYRASSKFFGSGENKNKDLILRIPRKMMEQMSLIKINGVTSVISAEGILAKEITVTSSFGDVNAIDCVCQTLSLTAKRANVTFDGEIGKVANITVSQGDVTLRLPATASFALQMEGERPTLDFPVTERDGKLICGNGDVELNIAQNNGKTIVTKQKNAVDE